MDMFFLARTQPQVGPMRGTKYFLFSRLKLTALLTWHGSSPGFPSGQVLGYINSSPSSLFIFF